jgi:TRAP-type C4-dicarboxylate transport system permease small subunit
MNRKYTLFHLLNILMAAALLIMAILVFGNVVLRYFFNSGITWSEEMARFLFIWLVFLGAIGALKDNQHLGVDMLIKRLSPSMKKIVYVTSNVLVIYTLWLVLDGSWKMTVINLANRAPATGLPLSYIFGIGIVMSVGMGIIVLYNLYLALFVKGSIDKLTRMMESEEEVLESLHDEKSLGEVGK